MSDDRDIYVQHGGTPDAADILARAGVLSEVVASLDDITAGRRHPMADLDFDAIRAKVVAAASAGFSPTSAIFPPTTVSALLAEVDRLTQGLERLRAHIAPVEAHALDLEISYNRMRGELTQERDEARAEVERLRRELARQGAAQALATAILTPDDPALPAEPRVIAWDWREQPDLATLAEIVRTMSDGRVHLVTVDTANDEYALVIAGRELTTAEALAAYDEHANPRYDLDTAREEGYEPDPDPDYGKDLDDEANTD